MQISFQNKYVQLLLVALVFVGIYLLFSLAAPNDETSDDMDMTTDDMASDTDSAASGGEIDYTGTHIMPDGSVMTGSGVTIEDAIIREDGMIELPNGTTLEPVMDMRQ